VGTIAKKLNRTSTLKDEEEIKKRALLKPSKKEGGQGGAPLGLPPPL